MQPSYIGVDFERLRPEAEEVADQNDKSLTEKTRELLERAAEALGQLLSPPPVLVPIRTRPRRRR